MKWKLKRTAQCAKCPWRKDVDPHDIPNGYSKDKHAALDKTIAKEGDFSFLASQEIHVMACHESHDAHCVGWLIHQAGAGNNIALRIHLLKCENFGSVRAIGPQHETFGDTLQRAEAFLKTIVKWK